jgi:hypothetical protein
VLKKIFYYFAICIIIGVIISAAFSSLPVYKFMAESFLQNLSKGQYGQAYAMLSKDFQERNDLPSFTSNIEQSGLNTYDKVVWGKEETEADKKHGKLDGIVITKQNTRIALEMEFVLVQGNTLAEKGWRIDNINIKSIEGPKGPQH